jgi:hypothetical protein
VPKKTLGKGSVTITWRRDGDFSLPSVKRHSANSLSSARQKVLGKEAVADVQFVERSLPSVTLGKAFAECKIVFAECLRHSAKKLSSVVAVSMKSGSSIITTDVAEATTTAHRPPRIGRTPSVIPAFAADRYALECYERCARFSISVSCSRLAGPETRR